MRKVRSICAALGFSIVVGLAASSAVFAANGWQKNDKDQWEYYEDEKLVKNRWIQDADGSWMYINGSGVRVEKTSASVQGSYYVFDENGHMMTGGWAGLEKDRKDESQPVQYTWYYAEADGKLYVDGWYEVEGKKLYFDKVGRATTSGVVTVDGNKYYIDAERGRLGDTPGWFSVDITNSSGTTTTNWYYAKADGSLYADGWFNLEGHTVYFTKGGVFMSNRWFDLDGQKICVNKDGDRLGPGWVSLSGTNSAGKEYTNWYYINGDMTRAENGFVSIDGQWYYFDKSGINYRERTYKDPDGNLYYLDEHGVMKSGGWFAISKDRTDPSQEVKNTWYYAQEDGKLYADGWYQVDGTNVYFNKNGVATRDGLVTIDDKKYYVDEENGRLGTSQGWFYVMHTDSKGNPYSNWYYAQADGSLCADGWFDIEGHRVYFNKSGIFMSNRWFDLDGQKVCVNKDGDRQGPGWVYTVGTRADGTEYKNWYYINEDMTRVEDGFHTVEGQVRYFDKNGLNYRERTYKDEEGNLYYLDENGVLKTGGWFSVDVTNSTTGKTTTRWYYADAEGKLLKGGLKELDGKTYYFSDNGIALRNGFFKDGNRRRYFGDDCAMVVNSSFSVSSTITVTGPATADLQEDELTSTKETWYFADENGYVMTGNRHETQTIDGNEYRLNASGSAITGWQRDGIGDYTYFGENGAKQYGWIEVEGAWYYLDPENEGKAVRARASDYVEIAIQGHYYGLDKHGKVMTGWQETQYTKGGIDKRHYYMPEAKDGFLLGERAANTQIYDILPYAAGMGADQTWFWFDENGDVIHSGESGHTNVKQYGNERIAVDRYGRTQSGLGFSGVERMPIQKVYYADPENRNALATGEKQVTLPDGRQEWYAFDREGVGITGVHNGYLYYKGRLQTGSGNRVVKVPQNEIKEASETFRNYAVDAAGKILSDAESSTFPVERAVGPQESDFSFYVGQNY